MKYPYPLVMVEWLDSVSPSYRWEYLEDFDTRNPVKCVSVGLLISEDNNTKNIAGSYGYNSGGHLLINGVITIPNGCVTKVTTLRSKSV